MLVRTVSTAAGIATGLLLMVAPSVLAPGVSADGSTVAIVVVGTHIPEGGLIDTTNVYVTPMPAAGAPTARFSSVESVSGRVALSMMHRGDILLPSRLAPIGTSPTRVEGIAPGNMRYQVRLDDAAVGVPPIHAGNRVDVLVLRRGNATAPSARTVVENVPVVAVVTNPRLSDRDSGFTFAELEVSPNETRRLDAAASQGQLHLLVRGQGDSLRRHAGDAARSLPPR